MVNMTLQSKYLVNSTILCEIIIQFTYLPLSEINRKLHKRYKKF